MQQEEKSRITSKPSTENAPVNEETTLSSKGQNNLSEKTETEITMTAVKDTYSLSTDRVNVIITNNTSSEYLTGEDYTIEYYNGSAWSKIPLEIVVHDIGIILRPKESKEFSIYLYPKQHNYISGKYRIRKTVSSDDGTYELTAEFSLQ